jgi:hypothetical protein
MNAAEALEIVDTAVARLGEHFDAVQIMVSCPNGDGGTLCLKRGSGNWYARQGMAQEFIGSAQAKEIADAITIAETEEEDD